MSTVTEETPQTTETTTHKWVYLFEEGPGDDKALLGGKGAGLCEMTRLGLPVPPGFVISTAACVEFFRGGDGGQGGKWPAGLAEELDRAVAALEQRFFRGSGATENPLLVSVRSGSAVSMPG